jgi:type IV pilus assembly protein PilC
VPKYSWVAVNEAGDTVKGVLSAETVTLVNTELFNRDLQPVKVQPKKSLWQFEITRKKVPRKDLMHFSRQLGVFVKAGIPILDALEVIASEMSNKQFKAALDDMAESLRGGQTFSSAAASHPEVFPDFYLGILRSAEVSGTLDTVLNQLSEYIERDVEARRKIVSALVYPGVVFVMSIATVLVLTIFVLPRFKTFFASLNAKLPLPTRILLHVTDFLTNWWFLFAGGAGAIVIFLGLGLRTQKGRDLRDTIILKLPVVGDLARHAILERFCRILSSMVGAGVPLPEAMAVTAEATNNAVYRRGLAEARAAMVRGEGLAGPLAETHLFPAAARQMFKVGEDTGTLDQQMETAAVYFDRELDYKIKKFTSLFEPAVILFMGVVVGFVAIALVSAMYGIYRQVKIT